MGWTGKYGMWYLISKISNSFSCNQSHLLFLQRQLFLIDLLAKGSALGDMPLCSTTWHFDQFSFVFQPPAEMCRKEKGHGGRFQGASVWHEKLGHCHKSLALRYVLWVGYTCYRFSRFLKLTETSANVAVAPPSGHPAAQETPGVLQPLMQEEVYFFFGNVEVENREVVTSFLLRFCRIT